MTYAKSPVTAAWESVAAPTPSSSMMRGGSADEPAIRSMYADEARCVRTKRAPLSATMRDSRRSGRDGSRGTKPAPFCKIASMARGSATLRSRYTATSTPGPTPRARK